MGGTFDFSQVSMTVAGFGITGFGDSDDAIAVARRNDMFTLITGADGAWVFIKSSDKSGIITLKLLPSSASNAVLSGLAAAAENGIPVPVPVMYREPNGNTIAQSSAAFVMKMPDMARGKSLGSDDWVLLCADLDIFDAGMT